MSHKAHNQSRGAFDGQGSYLLHISCNGQYSHVHVSVHHVQMLGTE